MSVDIAVMPLGTGPVGKTRHVLRCYFVRPSAPPRTIVPSSQADWDAVKDVIEHHYLKNNVRLKDVIEVMHTFCGFRATPRMYKAQFEKWNWHKYSLGPRSKPRRSSERPPPWSNSDAATAKGKKGVRRVFLGELGQQNLKPEGLHIRILESDDSRGLQAGLLAHRDFIQRWTAQDPRWKAATPFTKMGYDPAMISHFIVALLRIEQHEFEYGGRMLRAAFLELEDLVADRHLAAAWDCCVVVPQMAVNHGRPEVIPKFFRHLQQLCATRFPGEPMEILVRCVADLVEVLATPEAVCFYTNAAWGIWTDTMWSLLRTDTVSTLSLQYAYLVLRKTPDVGLVKNLTDCYNQLLKRAIETLGWDDTDALLIEFDALRTQARFNTTEADVLDKKLGQLLAKLGAKYSKTQLPPSSWTFDDRKIYRGCWYLLTLCAEQQGGSRKRVDCRHAFLNAPPDGDWVQYAVRLEEELVKMGKIQEADEIRARRIAVQPPKRIADILGAEERVFLERDASHY